MQNNSDYWSCAHRLLQKPTWVLWEPQRSTRENSIEKVWLVNEVTPLFVNLEYSRQLPKTRPSWFYFGSIKEDYEDLFDVEDTYFLRDKPEFDRTLDKTIHGKEAGTENNHDIYLYFCRYNIQILTIVKTIPSSKQVWHHVYLREIT